MTAAQSSKGLPKRTKTKGVYGSRTEPRATSHKGPSQGDQKTPIQKKKIEYRKLSCFLASESERTREAEPAFESVHPSRPAQVQHATPNSTQSKSPLQSTQSWYWDPEIRTSALPASKTTKLRGDYHIRLPRGWDEAPPFQVRDLLYTLLVSLKTQGEARRGEAITHHEYIPITVFRS